MIGTTLNSISSRAFFGCVNLATVNFTGSNKNLIIDTSAFTYCGSLVEISIASEVRINPSYPSSVTKYSDIDQNKILFSFCGHLRKVELLNCGGNNFPYIFSPTCTSLETVTIRFYASSILVNIPPFCFYSLVTLKDLTITNCYIKSVGINAFSNCAGVHSLYLPCSTLGEFGFSNCFDLESVDFSGTESLSIPSYCFYECKKLKTISLPPYGYTSLNPRPNSIGSNAFYGCSSLIGFTNDEAFLSVGASAFAYCTSLTNIPSSLFKFTVDKISTNCFRNCSSLLTVDLTGSSITSIEEYSFAYCSNLNSITLPTSRLNFVGRFAFAYCVKVQTFLFPDSVEYIQESVLDGCEQISKLTFPIKPKLIGTERDGTKTEYFLTTGLPNLKTITNPEYYPYYQYYTNTLYWYESSSGIYRLLLIAAKAYSPGDSISLSNTAEYAPYVLQGLETNTFKLKYTSYIGPQYLHKIKAVDFSGAVENSFITYGSDYHLHVNKSPGYPPTHVSIFISQKENTDIKWGNFGDVPKRFFLKTSIRSFTMTEPTIKYNIFESAFEGCSSLQYVDLGEVERIGESAFKDCTSLIYAKMVGVDIISPHAFENCKKMTAFVITSSQRPSFVDLSAFIGIGTIIKATNAGLSLTSISIDSSPTIFTTQQNEVYLIAAKAMIKESVGGNFILIFKDLFSWSKIQHLNTPSLKHIYPRAFSHCEELLDIIIHPECIIDEEAFLGCSKLVIPAVLSLHNLGNRAFSGCSFLRYGHLLLKYDSRFSLGIGLFTGIREIRTVTIEGSTLPLWTVLPQSSSQDPSSPISRQSFSLKDVLGVSPFRFYFQNSKQERVNEIGPFVIVEDLLKPYHVKRTRLLTRSQGMKNVFENDLAFTPFMNYQRQKQGIVFMFLFVDL